jgi:hypothetical protein
VDHGEGAICRDLRRTFHQSHGGLMINRPAAHGNPDSPRALRKDLGHSDLSLEKFALTKLLLKGDEHEKLN